VRVRTGRRSFALAPEPRLAVGMAMGEQPPLTSVMITTRNRLALLPRALESVFRQDYPRIEVLVLDDASSDGTSEYVRAHYPQVRLFRFEENRGYVVGRNLMMREAKGEYIVSLDDDAYFVNADAVSNVVERMQQETEVGVVNFRMRKSEARPAQERPGEHYVRLFGGGRHCIRKTVIEKVGYYRELFFHQGEETDLALRILDKGYRILSFSGAVIVHAESEIGRSPTRIPTYRIRNLLLCYWINGPFPWWMLMTARTIVGCLRSGWKERNLPSVLRGLRRAIKEIPVAISLRCPVSSRTVWLWFALNRERVTDSATIQRLYENPSRSLKMVFR